MHLNTFAAIFLAIFSSKKTKIKIVVYIQVVATANELAVFAG
jgi:hypothetical protein